MKRVDRLTQLFQRSAQSFSPKVEKQISASQQAPTHTVSFRVTEEERDRLNADAAGISRSAYIREKLLGPSARPRKTRAKTPVKDYEALARVLSLLGRSNLAKNLNELDWAVQNGVVKIDTTTAQAIKQACVDVAEVRDQLVVALGLKPSKDRA